MLSSWKFMKAAEFVPVKAMVWLVALLTHRFGFDLPKRTSPFFV